MSDPGPEASWWSIQLGNEKVAFVRVAAEAAFAHHQALLAGDGQADFHTEFVIEAAAQILADDALGWQHLARQLGYQSSRDLSPGQARCQNGQRVLQVDLGVKTERKKAEVLITEVPQKSTPHKTILRESGGPRLPIINGIDAGFGAFAGPTK